MQMRRRAGPSHVALARKATTHEMLYRCGCSAHAAAHDAFSQHAVTRALGRALVLHGGPFAFKFRRTRTHVRRKQILIHTRLLRHTGSQPGNALPDESARAYFLLMWLMVGMGCVLAPCLANVEVTAQGVANQVSLEPALFECCFFQPCLVLLV